MALSNGLETESPAKGPSECRTIPVLPVRYALSSEKKPPMDGYNCFKWNGVEDGLWSEAERSYYRGTLRVLRDGWVHLWSKVSFPQGTSIRVKGGKFDGKDWLDLPLADSEIWMAYSPDPWTKSVWEKMAGAQEREMRMLRILPKKYAEAREAQSFFNSIWNGASHCLGIDYLSSVVEEYRSSPGYLLGLEHILEVYFTWFGGWKMHADMSIFFSKEKNDIIKRWEYGETGFKWVNGDTIAARMKKTACNGLHPFFVALDDPLGLAACYAQVHAAYCGMLEKYVDWYGYPNDSASAATGLWNFLSELKSETGRPHQRATYEKIFAIFYRMVPLAKKFMEQRVTEQERMGKIFQQLLIPWMKLLNKSGPRSLTFIFASDYPDETRAVAEQREQRLTECVRGISAHPVSVQEMEDRLLPNTKRLEAGEFGKLLAKAVAAKPLTEPTEWTARLIESLTGALALSPKNGRVPPWQLDFYRLLDGRLPQNARVLTSRPSGGSPEEYAHTLLTRMEHLAYNIPQAVDLGSMEGGMTFSSCGKIRPTLSRGNVSVGNVPSNVFVIVKQKCPILFGEIQKFSVALKNGVEKSKIGKSALLSHAEYGDGFTLSCTYNLASVLWPITLAMAVNNLKNDFSQGEVSGEHIKRALVAGCQTYTAITVKKLLKSTAGASLTGLFRSAIADPWHLLKKPGMYLNILGACLSIHMAYADMEHAESLHEKFGYGVLIGGEILVCLLAFPALAGVKACVSLATKAQYIALAGAGLVAFFKKSPVDRWLENSYWGVASNPWLGKNEAYRDIATGMPGFALMDAAHHERTEEEKSAAKKEMSTLVANTLAIEPKGRCYLSGEVAFIFQVTQAKEWQSTLKIDRAGIQIQFGAYPGTWDSAKMAFPEFMDKVEERLKLEKAPSTPFEPCPDLFDEGVWVTFLENDYCCWACHLKDFTKRLPDTDSKYNLVRYRVPVSYQYSPEDPVYSTSVEFCFTLFSKP